MILHNGLIDLLFVYHYFVQPLPETLSKFVAGLCDNFPPIFDTKYIAEFHIKETKSSLEYIFKKSERTNLHNKSKGYPYISTIDETPSMVEYLTNILNSKPQYDITKPKLTLCENFAIYGYCRLSMDCTFSHDINLLLDTEEQLKEQKKLTQVTKRKKQNSKKNTRKRSRKNNDMENYDTKTYTNRPWMESEFAKPQLLSENPHSVPPSEQSLSSTMENISSTSHNPSPSGSNGHYIEPSSLIALPSQIEVEQNSLYPKVAHEINKNNSNDFILVATNQQHNAGFDAFATASIFSYYRHIIADKLLNFEIMNKIFLPGKRIPLILRKSDYN